jgi:hypothetical protein
MLIPLISFVGCAYAPRKKLFGEGLFQSLNGPMTQSFNQRLGLLQVLRVKAFSILHCLLDEVYHFVDKPFYRRGRASNNGFSFGDRPYMFMMRESTDAMVRSIVVTEQKFPVGVLAMITILGFYQSGLGADKLHQE